MDGDLLLVRMSPDADGKFGFNVKVSNAVLDERLQFMSM